MEGVLEEYAHVRADSWLRIDNPVPREFFAVAGRAEAGRILYAGSITEIKDLLTLLRAVERLVPLYPGVRLRLAGRATSDAYERQVRQAAQDLPVRFVGATPRAQMPLLYRAADIFVCPSTYQEPLGMVNVEAQACGTPVIASAVGGISDVVEHEVNGLLVPPGDVQALAGALLRLIHDRSLRTRLGSAARESSARLDWRLLAARLDEIYDRALHGASQVQLQAVR